MGKEQELLWEMINFELNETLEYISDLTGVWDKLTSENRKLILAIVSGSCLDDDIAISIASIKLNTKYVSDGVNVEEAKQYIEYFKSKLLKALDNYR